MKIILYEMKKIWNWKIIGIILIFVTLFYHLFLSYTVENFRNSHPSIERHDFSVEMTERYGPSITGEEIEQFVSERKAIYEQELDTYFDTHSALKKASLANYEEYQLLSEKEYKELTKDELKAIEAMGGKQTNYVVFKLQSLDFIMEETSYVDGSNNIMSDHAFESTMNYVAYMSVLIVLISLVLVAPVIINDRMKNMHFLQYTTKNGRKLINQQFKAILLSGLLLTTISILFFGRLMLRNDILTFWNNKIESFLILGEKPLFDLTFGNYLLWGIFFIYLLNISVTFFAFVISRYSQNMITMIMKIVPIFAVLTTLCTLLFQQMFSPYSRIYQLISIDGIEGIILMMLLLFSSILVVFVLKREKRIDIL